MEAGKVVEQLSDYCDRGVVTFSQDFKDAVRIGKKAVLLLAYDTAHRLDDTSLKLLLDVERRSDEPA
ncbi:hypothetical protein ES708_31128 [subsurface metagenome]